MALHYRLVMEDNAMLMGNDEMLELKRCREEEERGGATNGADPQPSNDDDDDGGGSTAAATTTMAVYKMEEMSGL